MEKLRTSQIMSLAFMLFAIFFGAGNMIFPPSLGQQAGTNFMQAVLGFVTTDVGISLLGILAVILAGSSLHDLAKRISPKFATLFSILIYMMLGPLFALPRTGAVSFELAVVPFLSGNTQMVIGSLIFTAIFFAVSYFMALNPNKIVDIVGKFLTPVLLAAIALISIGTFANPAGPISAPTGDYATIPFFKGFIEGYQTLDGFAALIFASILINSIRNYGITEKKSVVKYSIIVGIISSVALVVVYGALGYIGASSSSLGQFANGGQLLAVVTSNLFGKAGIIILGVAVVFACLTTSIGLISSFSEYFNETFPKFSYKKIALIVSIFSFAIANVGLSTLLSITLPVMIMVYPAVVVLIIVSFFHKMFKDKPTVYVGGMAFALVVGIVNGLESIGMSLGIISEWVKVIPMYDLGIGWVIPAIIGCILGYLIPTKVKKSEGDESRNNFANMNKRTTGNQLT